MTRFALQKLCIPFTVTLIPAPSTAPTIVARVDRIWGEAVAERPSLFDGTIVSVHTASERGIIGWVTGYRSFIAQRREPDLFKWLRVQPLAVSGILRCPEGLVLGRRIADVEQDRNCWEFVPAGVVDAPSDPREPIDLVEQLLRELDEETGLHIGNLEQAPSPLGILEDTENHVFDVVFALRTPLAGEALQAIFSMSHREHDALTVLAEPEVGQELLDNGQLSAVTVALMCLTTLFKRGVAT